jgi:hypothetical protein
VEHGGGERQGDFEPQRLVRDVRDRACRGLPVEETPLALGERGRFWTSGRQTGSNRQRYGCRAPAIPRSAQEADQ